MTPATVLVSKPAKRATPWSSWTTMSPVRRSAKLRSRPRPFRVGRVDALRRWMRRCSGKAASLRAGATNPSRRLASVKIRPVRAAVEVGPQAREVVGGALGRASLRPGDDGRVAGAGELLELGLGLPERAGGEVGGLGADLGRLVGGDRGEPDRGAVVERVEDAVGLDVQLVGVLVVEGDAHVGPVVAQARLDVLLGGDHDLRGPGMSSSSSRKRSTGSSSAMSGRSSSIAAISASSRCSGASSAAGAIST